VFSEKKFQGLHFDNACIGMFVFLIPRAVLRLLLHHPVPWALSRMSHKVEPGLNAYSDAATGEISPQAESKYVNAFESAEELARF
jgi:hypothetical protein